MRRAAILCALIGLTGTGVGCHVVTGNCDCSYDKSADAPMSTNPQPYTIAGPSVGAPAAELPAKAPVAKDGK